MARPNKGAQLKLNSFGMWEIRWTAGGRSRRYSTGTSDRRQAETTLGRFLLLNSRDDAGTVLAGAPPPDRPTVAVLLDQYWHEHAADLPSGPLTRIYISYLKAHFGHLEPPEITTADVNAFIRMRRAGTLGWRDEDGFRHGFRKAGDGAIRLNLGRLVAAMNHAVRNRRLARGDVPYIRQPAEPEGKDRWLTREEGDRLLAAAETIGKPAEKRAGRLTRCHRFVVLGLHTAARRTSLETLTWPQVMFRDDGRVLVKLNPEGRNQTKKRRPLIPASDILATMLRRAYDERISDYVMDHPGTCREGFEAACRKARLLDVTPHTMRHTWATWAAQRRVPMWEIAGVLGDTLATVTKRYAHHSPDHLLDAVNRVHEELEHVG